jgi:non-ribosomal peptide synthetase component F
MQANLFSGRPKGIIITHSNFSSSMRGHGPVLGIKPDSRVLQFCAYTCDVSMGEVWTTLTTGATVCVPSEHQRMNDLAATIRNLNITWTFQTPTVAAHLDPDEVGALQTLVYGSETASPENIASWADRVCLVNSYGPAETCIWATAQAGVPVTHRGSNIGFGLRCGLWVTEPGCHEKLVPIGAIGELIVEGPNVASGKFSIYIQSNPIHQH